MDALDVTAADTPDALGETQIPTALEHYGPLTTWTLNAQLQERPDAEVLCVAPNLQATAETIENIARPLSLAVEPNDGPDVWYLDTRIKVDERRAAQGSPPLDSPVVLPSSEAPIGDEPTAEEEAQREAGPPQSTVDIASASGVDADAIQVAYDEAERLEQQANGTPWPTHDITTGLCAASTVLIEPEQPSDPKFDRVPQKQILRTQ
jgi:hypothetical protein